MSGRTSALIFALAALLTAGLVRAEPDAEAPSVEALVALALARAPSIPVLEARLRASKEQRAPAGALPDPMLEVSASAMGLTPPGPASAIVLELRQELPYPGKRDARQAAIDAEVALRAAGIEVLRAEITKQVRTLYAQICAIDQEQKSVRAGLELVALLSRTVTSRYSTGSATREALLRLELKSAAIEGRLIELAAARAGLVAGLNELLDQPGDAPLPTVRALPEATTFTPETSAQDQTPELMAEQAAVAAAERRMHAAHLDERPDFIVGLGGGVDGMLEPVLMLRFGLSLPLWKNSKQAPLSRAAEEELSAAKAELRAVTATVRSDRARLQAAWQRDTALIALYTKRIVPQSRAAFEAAETAYLSSQGDFSSVIEDLEGLLNADVALARLQATRYATYAALERLSALAVQETEGTP